MYVNPLYYLRFCGKEKRIAYAPSFGRDAVPEYNVRIIKKYLGGFGNISVRERHGAKIIKQLTGRDVPVVLDPVLLIRPESWRQFCGNIKTGRRNKFVLVFFLDIPDAAVMELLDSCIDMYRGRKYDVVFISPETGFFKNHFTGPALYYPGLGPVDFLREISTADIVLTDSYHGLLFALNFNRNFWIFERNYGKGHNLSSRILSMLEYLPLVDRYITGGGAKNWDAPIDFSPVNKRIEERRAYSLNYLENCLGGVEK
jgi:hypothetical protein